MRDSDFDNSDNNNDVGNNQESIDKLIDSIEENTLTVRDAASTNEIMEANLTTSLRTTNDSIVDLTKVLKDTAAEQKKISEKQDKDKDKNKGKSSEEKLNSMNATLSQMLKIMSNEYDLQKKIEDRELRNRERGKGTYKAKANVKPTPKNAQVSKGGGLLSGLSSLLTLGGLLPKLTGLMKKIIFAPFKILSGVVKMGAKLVTPLVGKIFSPITRFLGSIGGKLLSKLTGVFGKMGGGKIAKIFSNLFSKLPMLAEKALPKLLAGLNIVGDIVMALSLIWKYIRGALLDWTKDSPILHKIVTMLDDIIMPISDFFDHLTDLVVGIFTGNGDAVWDSIIKMGKDLLGLIKGVFKPVLEGFNYLTNSVINWAKNNPVIKDILAGLDKIFEPIKAVLSWITDKAGKLAKLLGLDKIAPAAKKAVTSSVNQASDMIADNILTPLKDTFKMHFQSKEAKANEAKVLQAGKNAGLSGMALANFMGQTKHESTNFSKVSENLNYSASGLQKTFGKYFKTDEEAAKYAHNPQAIANKVYGNRMGNTDAGDGYKYRGRGFIQLTGKSNYKKYGDIIGQDLVNNPDLAAQPDIAAKIAAEFYKQSGAASKASTGDLAGARKSIQGGKLGLAETIESTNQYSKQLTKTEWMPNKLPDVKTPVRPAMPANPLTNQEKDLAKMRGITDTIVARTSDRGIKFNSAGERIGAAIKPVEKPTTTVAMANIKEIPKVDKNAQAQTALLSGINNNTAATTISNFGMDELPHSDTLLAAITGRGA